MRKLITAISCAVLALIGIGVAGCETVPNGARYEYPPVDESVRPNSDIPQMGTDFLDDG